ncbi:MAG: CDP-alcohol phosphatidyltransferase family protein [Trebonia sp.]
MATTKTISGNASRPGCPSHPMAGERARFHYDHSVGDRIVTWPNVLSATRLAGVPVFLWLVIGPRTAMTDIIAAAMLGFAGISDWLDGKLARMLNQTSRLGQLLDPAADRLYIAVTIIALGVRGIIPWWLFGALAGREIFVGLALIVLRRRTEYGALEVSFVGKAATLCLMYAFPLLFLGAHDGTVSEVVRIFGWAFAVWGVALYWWAALLYLTQIRELVKGAHPS